MNAFEQFWHLGYRRLVPIVPPDAAISDKSSMAKRKDARGKAVGVRGRDGKWFGFDFIPHESTEEDLTRWQTMGAGTGIKTGNGLIAIDADTLNEQYAKTILEAVQRHFGKLPVRIGRYPKALYLCRTTEPLRYTRVEFGELDDKGRLKDRVEVLSDGRQFVASGIHPNTGKPYTWPQGTAAYDDLPAFPAASVIAFLHDLRGRLPAAKPLIQEGAQTEVDQASLRGSPDIVRKAVELTPNTSEHFPTRESYRDFGYAIKAALPYSEAEAFDIFSEWCARWKDGDNDPGVIEADWRRMKPPYRRGANWLFELAEQHAPNKFSKAEVFFQPITEDASPFDAGPIDQNALEKPQPVEIKWISPQEWHGVEPPLRKWIVEGAVPDGEVTLLTGAGGVGKTLLAQQFATCVAKGIPFLGLPTIQGNVMAFLCEDSEDELHIRQRDINASLCLDMTDVANTLRIASRKYMDNLLVLWDRNNGAMKRAAVWHRLCTDAKAFKAKVLIVDTIADTFGGNEIDRAQVRQFVQSCLGRLAQEIGGAVVALGHPSRAGQSSGEGTSGSTAWHASVRSRLYLEHATKDGSGVFRKLTNKKANYGPQGDVFMLRWARGAFELVTAKQSAAADGGAEGSDALAGVSAVGRPRMSDTIDDLLLLAVAEMAEQGVAMSMMQNSPYFAARVLKARSDALGIYDVRDIEEGMKRAMRAGRIKAAVVGRKQNRHPVIGFVVADADAPLATTIDENAFEEADVMSAGVFD